MVDGSWRKRMSSRAPVVCDAMAVVADAKEVRRWRPALAAVVAPGTRGMVLAARGDRPGVDFVSRFFTPGVGVPEDLVIGSAHVTIHLP